MGLLGTIKRAFGYDAVEDKTHRRAISTLVQSEDHELPSEKRRKLIGQTLDIRRNYEVAAWAVRRHLDFVSTFAFRSQSGNPDWDRVVENFVWRQSERKNFDAAGRHSLRKALRLLEALRTLGGDVGILKNADGKVQVVEGDRIRNPLGRIKDGDKWCHGVKLSPTGAALAYAIHKRRGGSGYEFEKDVPSSRMYLHGYFDRYDQVRGISPLAAALNRFRDTYENIDYALAKAKVTQLIGLAVFRKTPVVDEDEIDDADGDGEDDEPDKLDVDKGPFTFNGQTGEDAKFLESNHPGVSFIDFTRVCIAVALKSLDIPFSFFDEAYTNFFGIKTALTIYLKSCEDKRQDNRDFLDHWTRWRLGLAIANGELNPAEFGLTWEDIDGAWRWIARGVPWFDKGREIAGDEKAISLGIQTLGDVIEERLGEDWRDTIDRRAEEIAYMREKGVPIPGEAPKEPASKQDVEDAIANSKEEK